MATRYGVKRALDALMHDIQNVDVLQPFSERFRVYEELSAEQTRIQGILDSHPVLRHNEELQQQAQCAMSALSDVCCKLLDDVLEASG